MNSNAVKKVAVGIAGIVVGLCTGGYLSYRKSKSPYDSLELQREKCKLNSIGIDTDDMTDSEVVKEYRECFGTGDDMKKEFDKNYKGMGAGLKFDRKFVIKDANSRTTIPLDVLNLMSNDALSALEMHLSDRDYFKESVGVTPEYAILYISGFDDYDKESLYATSLDELEDLYKKVSRNKETE